MVLKVRIVTTILRVEGYWKGEQRGHVYCKAGSVGKGGGGGKGKRMEGSKAWIVR